LLGVICLLAGPLGGAEMGAKPSPERTPPPTYERSNPNQYEKPLDLRLSPQTEEASTRPRGQKRNPASTTESSLTDKSATTKSKKKVKKLPDEEATSSGIDLGFKKAVPPPSPFSSNETEGRR
jgi:hypothetical protein